MCHLILALRFRKKHEMFLEIFLRQGFGTAKDRDPEAVARDVSLGYISADAATEQYGTAWTEVVP